MNTVETYKMDHECGAEITIPCDAPHVCPRCQGHISIEWLAGRKAIANSLAVSESRSESETQP